MSRYLERAEHTARLLDLCLHVTLDQTTTAAAQRWGRLLASLYTTAPTGLEADAYALTRMLTFDQTTEASIVACVAAARENARQAREQVSSEMWEQLNRLFLQVKRTTIDDVWNAQPHEFFQAVKEGAQLFQGITDSTMSHGEGWHFIRLGRHLERAYATTALLDAHADLLAADGAAAPDHYFELMSLLKCCTGFEAYCQVYTAAVRPERVVEFLLLNAEFPHSIRFSVDRVQGALDAIAQATGGHKANRVGRLAGRLRAALGFGQTDEILAGGLRLYLGEVRRQCAELHAAIYQLYISYPIEAALAPSA